MTDFPMNEIVAREVPACAAIRLANGAIFAGHRHHDCIKSINDCNWSPKAVGVVHGFMTTRGRFVNRAEAKTLLVAAGLPSAAPEGYRGDKLFSEDLY
jgi:hypothetical protein